MSGVSYECVIGLEVHIQLTSVTKIFSPDAAAFGDEPNRHVSLISLAHPGTLPRLNDAVVERAVRLGLACGGRINRKMSFDRKNYFYPDLPKGYQITQQRNPVVVGGEVRLPDGTRVAIHHMHLEEDAGKSVHEAGTGRSGMDFNRAGTPLVELVTEPCIRSAEDAAAFVSEIRRLVRFLGVSDGNMEEGSLRADANVSVRPEGTDRLGTKAEIKNMNSMRHLRSAIEFEVTRQVGLLRSGEAIVSETRLFDPAAGITMPMRTKEELNDYRYFPDPDLAPVVLTEDWLNEVSRAMPWTPDRYQTEFRVVFGLPEYDAGVLTSEPETAAYMLALCRCTAEYKAASNWMMGPVRNWCNDHPGMALPVPPVRLAELIDAVVRGVCAHAVAVRQIFPILLDKPESSLGDIVQSLGLADAPDRKEIEAIVADVLRIFPLKVEEYRKGKKGILAMFMGEVMKRTKGKADPRVCTELIQEWLEKN